MDEPAVDAPGCRAATYVCSVMAAWEGVPARGRVQIDTGAAPVAGEIAGDGFRCGLSLASIAPDHHLLRAECSAGTAHETFELHEPGRAFRTNGRWTLEPACWYAQDSHGATIDCDTCRPIDYCEGADVGMD